jgi:hypothetical protein
VFTNHARGFSRASPSPRASRTHRSFRNLTPPTIFIVLHSTGTVDSIPVAFCPNVCPASDLRCRAHESISVVLAQGSWLRPSGASRRGRSAVMPTPHSCVAICSVGLACHQGILPHQTRILPAPMTATYCQHGPAQHTSIDSTFGPSWPGMAGYRGATPVAMMISSNEASISPYQPQVREAISFPHHRAVVDEAPRNSSLA